MTDEDTLSSILGDFARTMLTDFRVQSILDRLVERIADVMPVTGAGVTLISPDAAPRYVAASDEQALRFERLQTDLWEGPCLSAYLSGAPVAVPDLGVETRFPRFGPAAVAAGLAAVFTFPLRHGDGQLGALDLYRDTTGPLGPRDLAAAQTLADVASAYLLHAQAREQVAEEAERFRHSSLHDPLTGLANRALLKERIEHATARASRSHSTAAVLFVDLDRFKRVNDTYGHVVGDQVLIAVGRRLQATLRPGDTLARVGGDEFVVLCEDLTSAADVEMLATRIGTAFSVPLNVAGAELTITASVGVAYSGPGETMSTDLLSDADTAMYLAKRQGGATHHVIDLKAAAEVRHRDDLEHDLHTALTGARRADAEMDGADAELTMAYQPVLRTTDGRLVGVEALLRWTHPVRGPVPALTAISTAERTGLIVELGNWTLDRSCRDHARWRAEHPDRPVELWVNVSARQMMARDFPATVAATLAATRTHPSSLVLEITESVFIEDSDRAATVLSELKSLGVRIALDDFGTGYSSLGYLRRFPVDIVKIDREFINGVGTNPVDRAIVTAIDQLARALGMSVTAEGIETDLQRQALQSIGCQSVQGYLYARPMSAVALDAYLGSGLPAAAG